jgi:formylmethanofuran dehydrogenase subunit E
VGVVSCSEVTVDASPTARLYRSAPCAACGELVMETRLQEVDGRRLCISCTERQIGEGHATGDTYISP